MFRREKKPEKPLSERLSFVTHQEARGLLQAEAIAMMLANSRDSKTLEITDVLAGMYVISFEKLVKYWPSSDAFEDFIEDRCHIDRERWFYWFEYCERLFQSSKPWNFARHFSRRYRKWLLSGKTFKWSRDLEAAYRSAEELTPLRSPHPFTGKELPFITSECMLLAISNLAGVDISKYLRESGLHVQSLEQAVRSSTRRPRF